MHSPNPHTWWFMLCFLSKQLSILALWERPKPRAERSMKTVDVDFPGWSKRCPSPCQKMISAHDSSFPACCLFVLLCFFGWVIYPRSVLLKLTDPPFTCLVLGTFNTSDLTTESYWWATKRISGINGNCIQIWVMPEQDPQDWEVLSQIVQ